MKTYLLRRVERPPLAVTLPPAGVEARLGPADPDPSEFLNLLPTLGVAPSALPSIATFVGGSIMTSFPSPVLVGSDVRISEIAVGGGGNEEGGRSAVVD